MLCVAPFGNMLPDITSLPCTSPSCQQTTTMYTFCAQQTCNSSNSKVRPVFQVCHGVGLPQLYSFHAYASYHINMNTKALCHIFQQQLKFLQVWHLK